MADWNDITIIECAEPMVQIDPRIARVAPHPYTTKGAQYPDGHGPFMLRATPAKMLLKAQLELNLIFPELQLLVFDAYRPVTVQKQMIELYKQDELAVEAQRLGLSIAELPPEAIALAHARVDDNWADPSLEPTKPPPHSTGGAVDLTLRNRENGALLPMGCDIDDSSPLSRTYAFAQAADPQGMVAHKNRIFLKELLEKYGFTINRNEWWHFDMGTQKAIKEKQLRALPNVGHARYGRYDLI